MKKFEKILSTQSHTFCGYYDKDVFCEKENKLLLHKVDFIDKLPTLNDRCLLGFVEYSGNSTKQHFFEETNTFNWQQGAMLEWLESGKSVVFNKYVDGELRCVQHSLIKNDSQILENPIYCLSPDKKFYITTNFKRHSLLRRAYSYDLGDVSFKKYDYTNEKFQITYIDKKYSNSTLLHINDIVSNKELANKDRLYYMEHPMVSPDSAHFAFLLRYKESSIINSKLFVVNIQSGQTKLLIGSGRIGHFTWADENTIVGWMGLPTIASQLRASKKIPKFIKTLFTGYYKSIIKADARIGTTVLSRAVTGDSYCEVNIMSVSTKRIGLKSLTKDGHPNIILSNPSILLTDTYPDDKNIMEVIKFDRSNNAVLETLELETDPRFAFSSLRCDLHPKISESGNLFAVDRLVNGNRFVDIYSV